MYSAIYKLFFCLKRKEKQKNINRLEKKILAYIEWYFNIFQVKCYEKNPSKNYGLNKEKRNQKIIVSLTSWPKRIDTIWVTVETLLCQSVKPDEIILWLAETQFDGLESLPQRLLEQQKRGLTIRFCDDLRSHKKYYYTMQEYPDDLVVLMDDDMFYPYDTIEKLCELHERYPEDICCITSQVMEPFFESAPSTWRNPKVYEKIEHSDKVQIFTGSGSMFVPNSLSEEIFDKKLLQELCPYADDLWLTFMAYRKGTRITSLNEWRAFPVTIYGTASESLWYINAQDGQNDKQWEDLINYYKE